MREFSKIFICGVFVGAAVFVALPALCDVGAAEALDVSIEVTPDTEEVPEGEEVTFRGIAKNVPEEFSAVFHWEQTGGAAVLPEAGVDGQVVFFTAPEVGPDVGSGSAEEYLDFLLTVTVSSGDQFLDSGEAEKTLTVYWVNEAPVAYAGRAQTVFEGDTVTLDGSGSSDPEGLLPLGFKWVLTAGTTVFLSNAETARPSFIAPEVEPEGTSLSFKLTVTDSEGLTNASTCVVWVNSDNGPPVADAGGDRSVDEGVEVTLDGSDSRDPDGDPLIWLWAQEEGLPVELSDPAVAKPTFQAPNVDERGTTLVFLLTVTDEEGLSDQDTCLLTVLGGNELPSVDAGAKQEVEEGERVFLDGSGCKDPEGEALKYLWVQTDGVDVEIETQDSEKASFMAPEVGPAGAYLAFDLFVEDSGGLKARDHCFVDVMDIDGQDGSSGSGDGGGGGCESGFPITVISGILLLVGPLLLKGYFRRW